jgi:serine protease Do
MYKTRWIVGFIFALGLSAQNGQQLRSRTPTGAPALQSFSQSVQQLVDQVSPAVVQVIAQGIGRNEDSPSTQVRTERGGGSGVILDPTGYIVTNAHVVGNSMHIQVLVTEQYAQKRFSSVLKPPGKLFDADVVGLDRETDIAVLKITASELPSLKLGTSETLHQGELVFAAGSPFGLQNSMTMGIVSSVARQVRQDDPMIYIQTDAAINPGNSGGPLINTEGEVVGISTFILSESGGNMGLGFAVPADIVRTVYDQIRKQGYVRRGQVGLVVQTITPPLAAALGLPNEIGAIVADVVPNGPAAASGVQVKDVILALNGKPIENARQFGVNIYQKADQTVTLDVLRNGEKKSIRVAVAQRPKDPDHLISLVKKDQNLVASLGILAVDLETAMPLMPTVRKLSGAVIVGAMEDGAAAAAGLRAGDVIYEINNRPIKGFKDLLDAAQNLKSGRTAVMQIERQGQLQFVEVNVD